MYSILLSDYEIGINLVKEKLREIIKNCYKVVIIPWAFPNEINKNIFEKEWFPKYARRYKKYLGPLLDLGIKEKNISILNCYDADKKDKFKKIIDESNVLVIPGGNPEMLYSKVVQETDLLYNIKYYKGIIIGASAGADLQLKRYFITSKNNYYKYFAFYDGFGVLKDPFYIDVHSIDDKKYLKKLQQVANEKDKKVYAIFDKGAVIYNRKNEDINIYGKVLTIKPIKK